jgi:hypothetical protein
MGAKCGPPPPGAADVALEQLAASIHKRPYSTHIVLIPRLLTSYWWRLLGKTCDLVFTVPLGPDFWPPSHFEPLIVGLYLPLLPFSPWQFRGTPFLDRLARQLSGLPRVDNHWGGGYSARIFPPDADLGRYAGGRGTGSVIGQRITENSLWYDRKMRTVSS